MGGRSRVAVAVVHARQPTGPFLGRNRGFFRLRIELSSYGSGILRIRFSHSSASEAPQISTSSSIASPMGKYCGTRITPGLEP